MWGMAAEPMLMLTVVEMLVVDPLIRLVLVIITVVVVEELVEEDHLHIIMILDATMLVDNIGGAAEILTTMTDIDLYLLAVGKGDMLAITMTIGRIIIIGDEAEVPVGEMTDDDDRRATMNHGT